jgi:glycogen synthase
MNVAMLGWEFPPFMSGGLGIHCLELTQGLAAHGSHVDFYMPRIGASSQAASNHKHVDVKQVDADPGIGPYGSGGGYARDFNRAVDLYNRRLAQSRPPSLPRLDHGPRRRRDQTPHGLAACLHPP